MNDSSLLTWIVFTPTIGAVLLLFLSGPKLLKRTALLFTVIPFVMSLWLIKPFLDGSVGAEDRRCCLSTQQSE